MISEVTNALFLTFLATEYFLSTDHGAPVRKSTFGLWKRLLFPRTQFAACLTLIANMFDRYSGISPIIRNLFERFLHLPKIVFAAIAYISALYVDCRLAAPRLPFFSDFLPKVAVAFLTILPVYPFLAVLISFGFLLIISVFEMLHLPLEWLNAPVYYGTLYGPFSFVYYSVKQRVLAERSNLPT